MSLNKEKQVSTKVEKLTAVRGMNDILPGESASWEELEGVVRQLMRQFAFENIRTPIVESTALFVSGTGQTTDIVMKEMYSFEDRLNGEELTLRPESWNCARHKAPSRPNEAWMCMPSSRMLVRNPGCAVLSYLARRRPNSPNARKLHQ